MSFPTPTFDAAAIEAAQKHAAEAWPEESCGIITPDGYFPCENIAENPKEFFHIDPEVFTKPARVLAVVHSHPEGALSPTAQDMRAQMNMGCIFGIIPCKDGFPSAPVWWGDFILEQPLIGRDFIHGINDCYSLVRAYFWQEKKILLPEFPRDYDWWHKGENHYEDNFLRLGFTPVAQKEVQPGDCFLGAIRTNVAYHGGVIVENGQALHHLEHRKSRREPIVRWAKFVTHWLRYTGG